MLINNLFSIQSSLIASALISFTKFHPIYNLLYNVHKFYITHHFSEACTIIKLAQDTVLKCGYN